MKNDIDYELKVKWALRLPDEVNTDNALNSLQVLQHFSAAVTNGIQPDERVMKAIAGVFSSYICQHQIVGEPEKFKSLDESFNLKPKKGTGHPIKQYSNHAVRLGFLHNMFLHRMATKNRGEPSTLMESAEWVSNSWKINGESIDADTLKRYYTEIGGDDFFINQAYAFEKYMGI
ncbi:hypothetical protein KFZ76_01590 [Methylovulum psychrotolerans]|uniref:hypothetical protein n=1 Tax=Methylovulum psychrotolerans TaxID=1704499 RepID=UPI001BFF5C84|nr:hypothetical protein [Methylovulum psychrotolerans]MBT9096401.1 hypothetical protein [Methylovulum psychrotolerans]